MGSTSCSVNRQMMDDILLAWLHGRPKRQEGAMEKRYRVTLTESERADLRKLVSVGKAAAQKLVRARILLLADQSEGGSSKSDPEIVESLGCGRASVERIRKRFVEEGLEAALNPTAYALDFARILGGGLDRDKCTTPKISSKDWKLPIFKEVK